MVERPATTGAWDVSYEDTSLCGRCICSPRRATSSDLACAQAAELPSKAFGLALLAARCPTTWVIVFPKDEFAVALSVAAVIASAEFGPIYDPLAARIFGVKTARQRLTEL